MEFNILSLIIDYLHNTMDNMSRLHEYQDGIFNYKSVIKTHKYNFLTNL